MTSRALLSAFVFLATMLAGPMADAKEIREPSANVAFELPDNWTTAACTKPWTCVAAPGGGWNIRMTGTEHRPSDLGADENFLLGIVRSHMSDIKADAHAEKVAWDNFAGSRVTGVGKYEGAPWRFEVYMMLDKKDANRGVAILVLGSYDGWAHHATQGMTQLRHLRAL
jgi:hypothetical protein